MDEHRTYWEFNSDHARFGYMKRRIEALEKEQSLLGQRVAELEARLRAENKDTIVGDVPDLGRIFEAYWVGNHNTRQVHDEFQGMRVLPPEQGDEHR